MVHQLLSQPDFIPHLQYIKARLSFASKTMNNLINYEILINLKSMNILSIRQSSFYQIRMTVYQTDSKNSNIFAVPFLMLKSQIESNSKTAKNYDITNTSQIDHTNNSFLSRKFIIRNIDEKVQINQMCIFKGSLLAGKGDQVNKEIRIYVELLSYQQNDVQLVEEWTGYTLNYIGNSYCPMYFSSYKFTCNINASIHLIVSSLSLENLPNRNSPENSKIDNVTYFKKFSRYLQESIEQLKVQLKMIKTQKKTERIQISDAYQYSPATYRYEYFKKSKLLRQMLESQVRALQQTINQIPPQVFSQKIKESLYLLNQIVYQFWKNYQILITKQYSQSYEKIIKSVYYAKMQKYHEQKSFLVQQTGQFWRQEKSGLFIYPFERHQTFLKLKKKDLEYIQNLKESKKLQLLILVHGYQASSYDMEPISNYLRYKYPNVLCLLSAVNEGKTEQQIEESAHRLAIQIKNYINSIQLKDFQINFVCHSLGGVIGRASLKYLQLHKQKFNQFVSLCSPHLGYLYHSSTLISTSLWILNKVKKDPSMIELTMSDHQQLDKTYIYEASKCNQLSWFNKIWLFGSKEDEYVPYWSAILEDKNFYFQTESAKIYKAMVDNLTKDIEDKIIRCEIIFNEKAKDLSNFIGRTAHIKILNFIPGLELLSSIFTP